MIPLFSTHISPHAAERVAEIIKMGWVNRGQQAELFESLFTRKFDYGYALSVNSCTSALRIAYALIKDFTDAKNGDEIITTPYTMIATNTAMLECGFKPVFADVEYTTANIDPFNIEERITKRTKAIAIVHYAGYPCNLREIYRIAAENELLIVEDCAQAIGAKRNGNPVGYIADFACFSFQAIKHITTGDGGMFVTNNQDVYEGAVKRAWFGIDKAKRIDSPLGKFPIDINVLGYKYAMNDIAATLGIEGLNDLDFVLGIRRDIARRYREELCDIDGITLMSKEPNVESAEWTFPIHVENRLKFAIKMRQEGIEVAVHNWRNDQYSIFGGLRKDLPNTERLNNDLIHIPLHLGLSPKDVEYIINTIKGLKW
jgi:perosamine synthetase